MCVCVCMNTGQSTASWTLRSLSVTVIKVDKGTVRQQKQVGLSVADRARLLTLWPFPFGRLEVSATALWNNTFRAYSEHNAIDVEKAFQ